MGDSLPRGARAIVMGLIAQKKLHRKSSVADHPHSNEGVIRVTKLAWIGIEPSNFLK